jgi:lysophospholipase L1-like esterase
VRRFLALGDSYTIGEGVADQERWPNQLVRLLRAEGTEIGDPHIVARTAWTTDELADAINGNAPKGPFDLVSLMVGVNDQYRSRPVQQFDTEFDKLLATAVGFAGSADRLLVISIPDWGATPFAQDRDRSVISAEIAAYNFSARKKAETAGAHWVDVTAISRSMLTEPALVAVDGLHPTAEMYRRWADAILPAARLALQP